MTKSALSLPVVLTPSRDTTHTARYLGTKRNCAYKCLKYEKKNCLDKTRSFWYNFIPELFEVGIINFFNIIVSTIIFAQRPNSIYPPILKLNGSSLNDQGSVVELVIKLII